MENNIQALGSTLSGQSGEILASPLSTSLRAKARLNTMLHLAVGDVDGFCAGNIYKRNSRRPAWIPTVQNLVDDFVQSGNEDKKADTRDKLAAASFPIVVEVNAVCDHAQNNVRAARFVSGLLVPEQERKIVKRKAEYIREVGPVFLESPTLKAGDYFLYFSARHLSTVTLDQVARVKAFARLRGQALVDLQVWFAHQATRPGMLMLTS